MIDIHNMSVLIVDDMRSMRLSIRNMFKQLGFGKNIRHAENGREGLKILESTPIDLVVIDWNMPVMNGITMLKNIRQSKQLRDMPVIMITAEAEREIIANVAETEIDAYLLKPLTMKSLDDKIRSVIHFANNPPESTIHLQRARDFKEAGDINSAIEETRLALQEKPRASRILRNLGLLYAEINNDKTAEKCFQKAVAVNKYDDISRYIIVDFYFKRNDFLNALKFYEQCRTFDSELLSKGMSLAESLLEKGMTQKAIEIFDQLIDKSEAPLEKKEEIANIFIQNSEHTYAKKLLNDIIENKPDRFDLIFKIAVIYYNSGDFDKALDCFQKIDNNNLKIKNIDDKIILDVKLYLARILVQQKKIFIADDYINQVLKIDPQNESALELRKQNL